MFTTRSKFVQAGVFVASVTLMVTVCFSLALAEPLTVKPDYIYVCIDETKQVTISSGSFGSKGTVTSSDPGIATAKYNPMTKKIDVTGVSTGTTTITIKNVSGESAKIKVKVFSIYMSA